MTTILLEAGASLQLKDEDGKTAEELCVVGSDVWNMIQEKKNKPLSLLHMCRNFITKTLYMKRKAEGGGRKPFGMRWKRLGELPSEVAMSLEYYC